MSAPADVVRIMVDTRPMAAPKNARGGRPSRDGRPARSGGAATERITVRLTAEERARIEEEAKRHGTTPGALMRDRALRKEPTG